MSGQAPYWLDRRNPDAPFPPVELALRDPNGLLAVGGDLRPKRLLRAYAQGIFPWYSAGQPILWWSPDPRMVLRPTDLKISRSLRKILRKHMFRITLDTAFAEVIGACAEPRGDGQGTWITPEMQHAYLQLHNLGHAHSVEAWQDDLLVGGLYGVALGRMFFGESMFTRTNDASKVAFVHLVRQLARWEFPLIDCQVHTGHLQRFGAEPISRRAFSTAVTEASRYTAKSGRWQLDEGLLDDI